MNDEYLYEVLYVDALEVLITIISWRLNATFRAEISKVIVGDPVGFWPDSVQNWIWIHLFLLSNQLVPFTQCIVKTFTWCLNHDSFSRNWLRTSFGNNYLVNIHQQSWIQIWRWSFRIRRKGPNPGSGSPTVSRVIRPGAGREERWFLLLPFCLSAEMAGPNIFAWPYSYRFDTLIRLY